MRIWNFNATEMQQIGLTGGMVGVIPSDNENCGFLVSTHINT